MASASAPERRYRLPSMYSVKLPPSAWLMKPASPGCRRMGTPDGTITASTSRWITKLSWACDTALLRGNRVAAGQCGIERVPAQAGALHPRGKFAHSRQRRQLAEAVGRGALFGQQRVHPREQRVDLGARPALDGLGHQRGRGHRDGAAVALETQIRDAVALAAQRQRQAVAAQRIVALRLAVVRVQPPEVARMAVVVEDHLAVQVGQFHQRNTSTARRTAFSSWCTSASVL